MSGSYNTAGKTRDVRNCIRITILRILLWPFIVLDRMYHVALFAISGRTTFDGFTLYSVDNDADFFNKAVAALKLLQHVDQRKYQRAKRYMPIIAHVRQGGNFYKHVARAFYVNECPDDSAYFASEIVHEATHAYLLSKGFRYEKAVRERHERICVREQLAFIVRAIHAQNHIPDVQKQELTRQWKQWFDEWLASQWWHERKVRQGQLKAIKKLLGELFN